MSIPTTEQLEREALSNLIQAVRRGAPHQPAELQVYRLLDARFQAAVAPQLHMMTVRREEIEKFRTLALIPSEEIATPRYVLDVDDLDINAIVSDVRVGRLTDALFKEGPAAIVREAQHTLIPGENRQMLLITEPLLVCDREAYQFWAYLHVRVGAVRLPSVAEVEDASLRAIGIR